MIPLRYPLAALLIVLLLPACGFQLRGATELPPELSPVYVEAPQGSPIGYALNRALNNRQVAVTRDRNQAGLRIRILEEFKDDRVMAVNSQGKIIATELRYRVRFDAVDKGGAQRVAAQRILLSREFVNPQEEVVGKSEEAGLLRRDMEWDMADRILHRIQSQIGNAG